MILLLHHHTALQNGPDTTGRLSSPDFRTCVSSHRGSEASFGKLLLLGSKDAGPAVVMKLQQAHLYLSHVVEEGLRTGSFLSAADFADFGSE